MGSRRTANSISFPRAALFLGAILVVALMFFTAPLHPAAQAPAPRSASLHIATWNVHDCSAADRKSGTTLLFHAQIAAMLREQQIDVIAFQEIQTEGRKGADIALLSAALERAGWPMPHVAVAKGPQSDDLAIFSRYPIAEARSILDPRGKNWPRPALEARIDAEGAQLTLYCAHFKAYDDTRSLGQRLAQASALSALIREEFADTLGGEAIVVLGDFNTVSPYDAQAGGTLDSLQLRDDTESANDFLSVNMKWLYFAPTYVSSKYSSITDHLIVSPVLARDADRDSIRVLDAPDSGSGFPISDHKLLVYGLSLGSLPRSGQ